MSDELIKAFDVAVIFDRPTQTVIAWAKKGWLPGAVWVGPHLWFNKNMIEDFVEAGCFHPTTPVERCPGFRVVRIGARGHAAGRLRSDRIRKPSDARLASLVKPDPGVRPAHFSSQVDYSGVESGRLLAHANTPPLTSTAIA